ncbi:zinc finger protein 652-like [Asterias rubens]|uniref:zinc finger protein 652-like n=1 Tax=Asterias rubens TaxID=7604 RepID=UPI0014551AB5|nr:zinc finger protein 652-like [Asterias rubens]
MDAEQTNEMTEKEPEIERESQYDSDSILTETTSVLQELLDKLDVHTAASQPPASSEETSQYNSMPCTSQDTPSSPTAEVDPDHRQTHQQRYGDPFDVQVPSLVSLPNEGERWARLRNQLIGSPYFEPYLRKTEEPSAWSIDEAFVSYCLDSIEGVLNPEAIMATESTQLKTVKKTTRRKGKPQKYERVKDKPFDDSPLPPSRKRKSLQNGMSLNTEHQSLSVTDSNVMSISDELEEDDFFAMDDNPSDLDYQPVPIIRYPKRRRKSLPRTIKNSRVSSKTPTTPKTTTPKPKKRIETDKLLTKKKAPAKKKKRAKKVPKPEQNGPPRKRGRPKKVISESQKATLKAEKASKQYVRMEVRLQRLPKMYECKTCFEQFPEAEDIKNHFFSVHRRESIPFPSQLTNPEGVGGTSTEAGVTDPDSQLTDITKLATLLRQCPKCKKFVDNMTVHKREHRERNFICEECGKGFTENQILQKHRKIHEMDRTGDRYKCEVCDKTYRFSQNLRSHMLYHGGEKTFICDHCGKSFYTNNRLIIHSAIHMKEKPYKCSECGRGFSQKSNMQKHERVHTGVKPYQCELCMESFNHKVSLKNHKKKHHGIDWWKDVGRPKPITTKRAKDPTPPQGVIVNRELQLTGQAKQNTVQLPKEQPVNNMENQWKGRTVPIPLERENNAVGHWRDDRQPVREIEQVESQWHRQENEMPIDHHNQPEEPVRLQNLQPAGNQWKGGNVPSLERQGQPGDPGMAAFFYPSTYLQGYPSGYPGMPVIPLNSETSGHPATRPSY